MKRKDIRLLDEASECLLCSYPSCEAACPGSVNCAEIIRSVVFDNAAGASKKADFFKCADCKAPCEKACRKNAISHNVRIKDIMKGLQELTIEPSSPSATELSLQTSICGVRVNNPFLLSSSVVDSDYEMVAKAFRMGWGGACMKTVGLFVPDEVSPRFGTIGKAAMPFVGFKNAEQISDHRLEENLNFIRRLKTEFPDRLIIASIMGRDEDEWKYLAHIMEEAGADIIELNFSCPQMVGEGVGSDVGTSPALVKKYTRAAKAGTSLPVLAKMTPNITDMCPPARAAKEAGADGIAAINTIKSVMNIDLDSFVSEPKIDGKSCISGYSGKAVKPIALRFIVDMKKDTFLSDIPISGMGGISTWRDAAEFIALGCSTVQITTAVMEYGYRIIDDLTDGMKNYMQSHGYETIDDFLGKAISNFVSADDLNRHSIEYPRFIHENCIGCGRCVTSCFDGGHQALHMDEASKVPVMNARKCVGCQLCMLVCPAGAVAAGTRIEKKPVQAAV